MNAPSKAARNQRLSSHVRGCLDSLQEGVLRGWVFDDGRPGEAVEFAVVVDNQFIARGVADSPRPDLRQAGFPSENHGFELAISPVARALSGKSITLVTLDGRTIQTNGMQLPHASENEPALEFVRLNGVAATIALQWDSLTDDEKAVTVTIIDDQLQRIHSAPLTPQVGRLTVDIVLPPGLFDGTVHHFQLGTSSAALPSATFSIYLPPLLTPWEHLLTGNNPVSLAHTLPQAQHRYVSLVSLVSEETDGERLMERLRAASALLVDPEVRTKFPPLTRTPPDKPRATVVIPVYNQFAYTYHCVASLIACPNRTPFDIIIADDCSTDETLDAEGVLSGLRVLHNEKNLGFLRSVNAAVQHADTEFVVLLNNDTEVTPYWLDELLAPFETSENVGLTGSKLLYPDGRLQEAGGIIWKSGRPWNYGRGQNPHHPRYCYTREADYVSGAALCIPTLLWRELGGFSDELAPAYYEDTDLACKVRDAGKAVVFAALSEVYHFEGRSNGTDVSSGVKKHQEINAPKFRKKWRGLYQNHRPEGEHPHLEKDRGAQYRVLALDYATPNPQTDAGSYAAVQEMRVLQSLGCKVTFLPENMAHMGETTRALQRQGVEVVTSPHYPSPHHLLEERGGEFDLVYITRFDVAERWLPHVRAKTRAKVLLNNADLHFLRVLRGYLAVASTDLSVPIDVRERELKVMREVDAVLSYNSAEHAVIASHNLRADNLFLAPWVLGARPFSDNLAVRKGIAFLGGFRHYPNVEAVTHFVKDIWPKVLERCPGETFHIYGSYPNDEVLALASESVKVHGFVESLDPIFAEHRVFVAPLISGAGIKGKVLEAFGRGLPSVLSPIAIEGTGAAHGVHCLVADGAEHWVDHVETLLRDENRWETISQHSRLFAEEAYSFEHACELMRRSLEYLEIYC